MEAESAGGEDILSEWTPAELGAALGADDGEYAARVFGVTQDGTFEHGSSVLQLRQDPDEVARLARISEALLAARAARARPGRDAKAVARWHAPAISPLAAHDPALPG